MLVKEIIQVLEKFRDKISEIRLDLGNNSIPNIEKDFTEKAIDLHNQLVKFLEDKGLHKDAQTLSEITRPKNPWTTNLIPFVDSLYKFLSKAIIDLKQPSKADLISSKTDIEAVNKVFIVHGHDEANLLKLEDFLKDELHLDPVILFKKAGRSRFLLTKFEEEAKNARFAFIMMTPDDKVTTSKGKEYFQARPNVFFELGWFCEYLGQQNVCIIIKEGTEIHSDFGGVEIIWFKESVEEKFFKIKEELKATNLFNKIM